MNKTNTPFRYDYVGSFLRPAALKQARADFQSGRIDAAALKAVEDDAIRDLVAKQKAAGYHVITDGEFRRATWHLDFMWGFHGVGHTPTKTGLPFQGESAMLDDTYLTGKVSVDEHPFVEHFRFVKALEDENTVVKLTIPAPAQFLEQMVMPFAMENTKRFYPSVQELMDDLAAGYRLVDPRACMIFDTDAKGLEEIKEQMLTVNNMAIGGKPDDLVVNTHVCRGNFHSTYASSGAYDSVAKTLLARENVNAYYLEFDDARSGGFEPLASVSGEKKVVLGLVTTKRPELENKDAVIARIHEAAKHLPLDRLCLSPQCGFASCEIGNKLTEAQQWAKLALVKEIAEEVWG